MSFASSNNFYCLIFTLFIGIEVNCNSRFFIDNDWLLSTYIAFPIDECIQTSPDIPTLINPAYVLYSCSSDNQTVTKYKWDGVTNPSCDSSAYFPDSIIQYSITSECNNYFFNCDGADFFATVGMYIDSSCKTKVLDLKVVTSQCYCEPISNEYKFFDCNSTTSLKLDFVDDSTCVTPTTSSIFAEVCTFQDAINLGFITVDVYGSLYECIVNGENVILTSTDPTSTISPIITGNPTAVPSTTDTPTTDPIAGNPTNSPTMLSTMPPTNPTTSFPTLPPTPFGNSRFVLDNDWIGSPEVRPVPIDQCITTWPNITFLGNIPFAPEYIHYECSSDNKTLTKRKWIGNRNPLCDLNGELPNETTVWTTETYNSSCEIGYFVCDGANNYVSVKVEMIACDSLFLFNLKAVTGQCWCNPTNNTNIHTMYACNSTTSFIAKYDDSLCSVGNEVSKSVFSDITCDDTPGSSSDLGQYGSLNMQVWGTLLSCVVEGSNISPTSSPTFSPTTNPTSEPTIAAPTSIPSTSFPITAEPTHTHNRNGSSDALGSTDPIENLVTIAVIIAGCVILMLIFCICYALYIQWKPRTLGKSKTVVQRIENHNIYNNETPHCSTNIIGIDQKCSMDDSDADSDVGSDNYVFNGLVSAPTSMSNYDGALPGEGTKVDYAPRFYYNSQSKRAANCK